MPKSRSETRSIFRSMILAFVVVAVMAGSIIWFSFDSASRTEQHSELQLFFSAAIVFAALFVLFSIYTGLKDRDALYRIAYYDSNTGLPNFALLHQELEPAIEQGEQGNIILLKLSRIRRIYATYGPEVVTKVYQEVTKFVLDTAVEISPQISVYQMVGDVWGICDRRQQSQEKCRDLAELLLRLQQQPLRIDGMEISINCHIGAVCYPQDAGTFDDLIRNVVATVELVSDNGSDFRQFKPAILERYQSWMGTDLAIRQALQQNQFEIYYQPKISGVTGKISSAEALIRWRRDDQWISPGEFIPVAEQSGLIIPLGAWVLETVCKQIRDWQQRGVELVPIAINISAQQYQDETFVGLVDRMLKKYQLSPEWIELEITEEVAATAPEYVIETMRKLKKIGVKIALDDFGTGYSSLSYLKRFPLDTMKIDRSFVMEMEDSSESEAIVDLILALADELGYSIVAEGVETETQAANLAERGCDLLQGFLFSRPVPTDQFESLLERAPYTFYPGIAQ